MQSDIPNQKSAYADFKPQKDHIDLNSVKMQMSFGAILILIVCLTAYFKCFKVGFLLDDYLHVNYCAQAMSGHPDLFFNNFVSNWAGSDIMKSYRPLSSLSIFIDYFFWGTKAFGFHLTNLLIFYACCIFVSLITLELTGRFGNRLLAAPAIWAGLLFAIYPLHPESVVWIIGRVDLLCTLFYLVSIFYYLRFRLTRQTTYFVLSLGAFFLSLSSKEMAVTLPLVISALELCLFVPSKTQNDESTHKRLKYVLLFWCLLIAFAVMRTMILGTTVGGYAGTSVNSIMHSMTNFLDKPTLLKIIFPVNEETYSGNWLQSLLVYAYEIVVMLALLRIFILRSVSLLPYLCLLIWIALANLPTFQVWHIYPNLVGSRLFFLASAPLCMLLPLLSLPAFDWAQKNKARIITSIGTITLMTIFLVWSQLLELNIKPWIKASYLMQNIQEQIRQFANKQVLLLNLPQDISGAGMVGREQYLSIMATLPFCSTDISSQLHTIDSSALANRDLMEGKKFIAMLSTYDPNNIYIWDWKAGKFIHWSRQNGDSSYEYKIGKLEDNNYFSVNHKEVVFTTNKKWSLLSNQSSIIDAHQNFIRIIPGIQGITISFPKTAIDPIIANQATIDMEIRRLSDGAKATDQEVNTGKVKLVWQSKEKGEAIIQSYTNGHYIVALGSFRKWTLNGQVKQLGLRIEPGNLFVDFHKIQIDFDN